jgi:ABC-type multidrug transport system fused ATPase/permease subunit
VRVRSVPQTVVGIILGLCTAWRVCILVFPGVPVAAAAFAIGGFFVRKQWWRHNDDSSASAAKAEEVATQLRTVRASDCEMHEANLYAKSLDGVNKVYKRTSYVHATKEGFIRLVTWVMIADTMYYTIYVIKRKPQFGVERGT